VSAVPLIPTYLVQNIARCLLTVRSCFFPGEPPAGLYRAEHPQLDQGRWTPYNCTSTAGRWRELSDGGRTDEHPRDGCREGNFVVFELKLSKGPDRAVLRRSLLRLGAKAKLANGRT